MDYYLYDEELPMAEDMFIKVLKNMPDDMTGDKLYAFVTEEVSKHNLPAEQKYAVIDYIYEKCSETIKAESQKKQP